MKNSVQFLKRFGSLLFSICILFSTFLMARIILPYRTWEWDVDFLITKQLIIHLDHYRIAFYTHIFSSGFVLFFGAFLFSSLVLKKFSKVHRSLGKLYVGLILLFCAPSGLVMAFYANGGFWVKISFMLLTPLWWIFTYKGFLSIRKGDFGGHKKWMIRSYALTLSAVSLRAYQFVLGQVDIIEPENQYLFISWVSWTGNLLAAELFLLVPKIGLLSKKVWPSRIKLNPS